MIYLSVVKDFTDTPGVRLRTESLFSGQQFREELLEPKFLEALNANDNLEVNLDGTFGYTTSFLEEAFGGLARIYNPNDVKKVIFIVSDEAKRWYDKIDSYIANANNQKKP